MIWKYLLVYIFQVIFNILKVQEIKLTYENKTGRLMINTILISAVVLASTYYSLNLMLKGDFIVAAVYIFGSVSGKYIAMTKSFNYRNFIWKKLKEDKQ